MMETKLRMRPVGIALLAVIAVALTIFGVASTHGGGIEPASARTVTSAVAQIQVKSADEIAENKQATYGDWIRFASADHVVALSFGPLPSYQMDPLLGVTVTIREAASSFAGDEVKSFELSTSYSVIDATPHWSRDAFVHGIATDGSSVLEHWYFPPQVGGWNSYAQSATTPLGVPGPTNPTVIVELVGGLYVPFSERTNVQRVRRKEVYRGASPSVLCASYDLDARFLIFAGGSPSAVYTVSLAGSSQSPQVSYSATLFPEVELAESIHPLQNVNAGRCYYVGFRQPTSSGSELALLWDIDNDGFIDFHDLLTEEQFESQYSEADWDLSVLPWARDS